MLLLLAVAPGAAAFAVVESDAALRTTLRDCSRRDDARDITVRTVTSIAASLSTPTDTQHATLAPITTPVAATSAPERTPEPAFAHAPVGGGVRLALLNLPPPVA